MNNLMPPEPNFSEELVKEALKYAEQITTPPLQEIGAIFADQVRFWRYKNQINILLRAEKYHKKKGVSIKKIPVKTLASLMEYSSLEEDESMQDMWAKLLTNATDPDNIFNNHFLLINILKELSSDEILILNYFLKKALRFEHKIMFSSLAISYLLPRIMEEEGLLKKINIDDINLNERSKLSIDNLMRLNLVKYENDEAPNNLYVYNNNERPKRPKGFDKIKLTTLGKRLVLECNID